MTTPLHRFHDGSTLYVTSAKYLTQVPVWKGNRILDTVHAESIRKALGTAVQQLDSGYRIIEYEEPDASGHPILQSYLIDGQHRAHVLRQHFDETLCEADFPVVVTVKRVDNESDAIAFFNAINHCKPQVWRLEPNLLLNKYIDVLVKRWGSGKKVKFIRQGLTRRPYLSVDTLREELRRRIESLKQTDEEVEAFAAAADAWNRNALLEGTMRLAGGEAFPESTLLERCIETEFMLAFDAKAYRWIDDCLK